MTLAADVLIGTDHDTPNADIEALVRARPGDEVGDRAELLRAWLGRPSWHRRAACRGADLNLFFPVRGGSLDRARQLCAACPVTSQCLAEALALDEKADDGFRAGLSANKRRLLRRCAA